MDAKTDARGVFLDFLDANMGNKELIQHKRHDTVNVLAKALTEYARERGLRFGEMSRWIVSIGAHRAGVQFPGSSNPGEVRGVWAVPVQAIERQRALAEIEAGREVEAEAAVA